MLNGINLLLLIDINGDIKRSETYLKCGDKLPMERKQEILDMIIDHFELESHDDINQQILHDAVRLYQLSKK